MLSIFIVVTFLIASGVGAKERVFRVPLTNYKLDTFDPLNSSDHESLMITTAMYSGLLTIDEKSGRVIPDLAESFEWRGSKLQITLKDNLKTSKKRPFSANEIVGSLTRALLNGKNPPGLLHRILCADRQCRGIRMVNTKVIEFTFPTKSEIFLTYTDPV
ncbi:MAG: hypothetical protein HRU19_30870 [Pseudobacteriovorax sp.]|nr:hypothetical protein [Pseudobacteriovorax sp.]